MKKQRVSDRTPGMEALPPFAERKSLGQLVFENLRLAIVRGGIAPGTRLVESLVADSHRISRTPVREAFHKLERERFVEKLPHGGFVVLGLNREDIVETFGIRSVLEGYAASLAARNHRPEELKPLQEKVEEFQRLLDKRQLRALPDLNTEFHDRLYTLSKSPRLIAMIHGLRDHIFRYRQIILKEERRARMSNEDHKLMLKHIRRRDAEGVERLVREHILRGQNIVLELFEQGSPPPERA
jgi:DNA-binding GntR family transcriptional regulator